jgi:hypothetical protein
VRDTLVVIDVSISGIDKLPVDIQALRTGSFALARNDEEIVITRDGS